MEKLTDKNSTSSKKVRLLDYLLILVKWRKLIIVNFLIVSIFVALFSLIMPKTFTAKTVILPPKVEKADISSFLSNIALAGIDFGGTSDETNIFLAILRSRIVMESVVNHFNLMERYNVEEMEEAIKILDDNLSIQIQEEGTIAVKVNAQTGYFSSREEDNEVRQLAAETANFFVSELDRINKFLKTTQARYNRIFIEKRYEQNKLDLAKIEQDFKEFQEEHNAIALPEQIQAAISSAADIKAQIMATEIELGALNSSLGSSHPEVRKARTKIRELKGALKEMKYGSTADNSAISLFPAFTEAPELGIRFIQLKRELEVQNKLYEFLTQQYEQAKIQEAKDTPTVQILDKAVPVEKRVSPKRAITTLVSGFLTIIISCFLAFGLERWAQIKREETATYSQIKQIVNAIKSDFKFSHKEK